MEKIFHKLMAVFVFFCSFIVYLLTLYPNMPWGDPGFLSVCSNILGIPHPPSFPIFILWGKLFNLIPINNPAWRTNLMSAFWGSLGLALLYLLIIRIFAKCHCEESISTTKQSHSKDEIASPTARNDSEKEIASSRGLAMTRGKQIALLPTVARNDNEKAFPLYNFILIVSAISGVLGLGFASAFWFQTIRAEVYTLNFFFTVLVLHLLIKWSENFNFRIIALACFIYGLSFANHSFLMVTLFPAFLIFVAIANSKEAFNLKRLPILFGLFLLAITIYLFLLIRANQWPAINSGTPDSWRGLFGSVTRSSDLPELVHSYAYENRFWFCLSFPVYQFSLVFFGWGILGIVKLLGINWRLWTLLVLTFILNVLTATWAANFSLLNKDILGYLVPSLTIFAIYVSFGFYYTVLWLVHLLRKWSVKSIYWVICVFLVLFLSFPTYQLFRNLKECNQSENFQSYEFGKEIISNLGENAIILTVSDYTLHTFWYLVNAEKIRPDVKIIGIGMKRHRAYIRQLRKVYPEVKLPAGSENVDDLASLERFLYGLCELNYKQMPIYYDYYYGDKPFLKHLMPHGFVFEYKPEEFELSDSIVGEHYDYFKKYFDLHKVDKADTETQRFFSAFLFNIGIFYSKIGKENYADKFIRLSFDLCPYNSSLYYTMGMNLMEQKNFDMALVFLQASAELNPYDEEIYYSLAHCCFEMGDYSKTEEMLMKASAINPHSASVKKRLEELKVLKRKGHNEAN